MKIAVTIDNHRRLIEGKEPVFPCSDVVEVRVEELEPPQRQWLADRLRFAQTGVAYCQMKEGTYPFLVDELSEQGLLEAITQQEQASAPGVAGPYPQDPRRDRLER